MEESVLISVKMAESLISSQQAVYCQFSKLFLLPFIVSLQGSSVCAYWQWVLTLARSGVWHLFFSVWEQVCILTSRTLCAQEKIQSDKLAQSSKRVFCSFFFLVICKVQDGYEHTVPLTGRSQVSSLQQRMRPMWSINIRNILKSLYLDLGGNVKKCSQLFWV